VLLRGSDTTALSQLVKLRCRLHSLLMGIA
jgi:hypothetical protein